MTQTTFTTWAEVNKMSEIDFMQAEDAVMETVDRDRLADILAEDGGLHTIERVDFTPGGNFVMALTGSGQVIGVATGLVS